MAPSGCSGHVPQLLLIALITFTIPSSSSQVEIYRNSTIGVSAFTENSPEPKMADMFKNAILNEILEYNFGFGCSIGTGTMYDYDKFALLVAITRYDLQRFANYSCDVDCAVRWLQLGGGIYDRVVTSETTRQLDCTYYAFPVKQYSYLSTLQVDHYYYSVGNSFYGYREIDQLTYAQVVTKWADAMQRVEQFRMGGSGLCYNISNDFAYARRGELLVSILWAFRQTLEVGWYYEHFTLATYLNPFCGPEAVAHTNQYAFHYFVWSLTNAVPFATNKSIRSYVSYICPAYGTLFPVHLAADLHQVVPAFYLGVLMTLPDIMHHYSSYVRHVMVKYIQYFLHKDSLQPMMLTGDALEWIQQDFMMFQLGTYYDDHQSTSIDRSIIRKIVFHLFVSQMAEKFHEKDLEESEKAAKIFGLSRLHFGYIVGLGLVCFILLVVGVCIHSLHYSTNSKKANRPKKKKKKIKLQRYFIRILASKMQN